MTATSALLLALTLGVAVVDWAAVQAGARPLEYLAKPLTMVLLVVTVLSFDDVASDAARWLFVVALLLSLAGDVFLVLPDRQRWFVAGLGAFLVAHLAYVPGLWLLGLEVPGLVVGLVVVVAAVATVGRRVVGAVQAGQPELAVPVTAYLAVISAMVVSAFGTASPFAIAGASLFYASDALIAWTSFVEEVPWGRVAIMVTYHLGQAGLVLSLL